MTSVLRSAIGLAFVLTALSTAQSVASAQTIENMAVYRIRLNVRTCDRDTANSDDDVVVRLTDASTAMVLDNQGNDRERGNWDYYEVVFPTVTQVKNLRRLQIQKNGIDAWCIEELELILNEGGPAVYKRSYPNGLWIDGNDGYQPTATYSYSTLRAASTWNLSSGRVKMCYPPTTISAPSIATRVRAVMTHANWSVGSPLYWGGLHGSDFIELWKKDSNSIELDIDMKADVEWNWGVDIARDPGIDIDMQADVSCSNQEVKFNFFTLDVDVEGGGVLAPVFDLLDDSFDDLASGFKVKFNGSIINATCPKITITDDGWVRLDWGSAVYGGVTYVVKDFPLLCYQP